MHRRIKDERKATEAARDAFLRAPEPKKLEDMDEEDSEEHDEPEAHDEISLPSIPHDGMSTLRFGQRHGTVNLQEAINLVEGRATTYPPIWNLSPEAQERLKTRGQYFPHLPLVPQWGKAFDFVYNNDVSIHLMNHYFLNNTNTLEGIIDKLNLDKGPPRTILEGYTGVGSVTQRFLRHPNVKQVLAMENLFNYWAWLTRLENPPKESGVDGNKLTVFPYSAWEWNSYTDMERGGAFDYALSPVGIVPSKFGNATRGSFDSPDWQAGILPLEVFMTIPNSLLGEQLVVQMISAMGTRTWMYRYGRIKLHLIITENLADRLVVSPGSFQRSKINVTTDALAHVDYHYRGEYFLPLREHIYPSDAMVVGKAAYRRAVKAPTGPKDDNVSSALNRQRLSFVTITPRKKPLLDMELYPTFDWLMKQVLVLRTSTIYQSLRHVAPGAEEIVNRLSTPDSQFVCSPEELIDPQTRVCDLTTTQLVALARVFDIWPFKPPEVESEINSGSALASDV